MMKNKGIWIVCDGPEFDNEHILQLLNKANILAKQLTTDVSVISIGKYNESAFKTLIEFGATNIIFCENNIYDEAVYANIIGSMMQEKRPELLIFPATQFGKTLAASLSSRFEAGLTADCIDIEIDTEGELVFSRAALNESVIARIKCTNSKFQMCTIKQNVFPLTNSTNVSKGNIENFSYDYKHSLAFPLIDTIEKKLKERDDTSKLNSAKVVFAVGRGVKSQETFKKIENLAKKYNGEIIGTRAAVESGLIEKCRQVGQSGVNICPNIYVAFGISGASQHMVGIKNAKLIIAVNSDKNAPIFNYADYSIVDDLESVLNEFNTSRD